MLNEKECKSVIIYLGQSYVTHRALWAIEQRDPKVLRELACLSFSSAREASTNKLEWSQHSMRWWCLLGMTCRHAANVASPQ